MNRRVFFKLMTVPFAVAAFASRAVAAGWTASCTKCDFKASGTSGPPFYKNGDPCPKFKCSGRVLVATK